MKFKNCQVADVNNFLYNTAMEKPKLVGVLIVKNEEQMLSRCLDSIKGLDNLYIVDTGSTDNTIEVAKKYTENVYDDYKWNDNFAEARNHAKDKVKEENAWILSIDADEFLHEGGVEKIREAVDKAEAVDSLAIDLFLHAESDGQKHTFPRLFKKHPDVFWEGAVHNHINQAPKVIADVHITYGYSPAHQKDPHRAFRILKKEVDRTGNPREIFYLGREYWYRGEYKTCAEVMNRYVKSAHFMAEKADAYLIMARCYWAMGMGEDARHACMEALIINPHFKEAVLFMATLAGRGSGNPVWEKNGEWWMKASELSDNTGVLFVRT